MKNSSQISNKRNFTMAKEKQQSPLEHKKRIRSYWTKTEDDLLLQTAVEVKRDTKSYRWVVIASFIPNRSAKQCRDRWRNYINPNLNNSPLTWTEKELIKKLYIVHGSKWSMIASKLENRSENTVKNWFRQIQRRNSKGLFSYNNRISISEEKMSEDSIHKREKFCGDYYPNREQWHD